MKGIRRDRYGIRAYVRVYGVLREKRFKPDTPLKTIKNWRDETRVALRKARPPRISTDSLQADVVRYLEQVRAMPTYQQRKDHLALWTAALGPTVVRASLQPEQIRIVLQQWKHGGLSAATCNKRRTALMHLFSVLDGKDARNQVRAVPKFRVDDPLPRGRDPHAIDAALTCAPRCRSRACCRVLLWTGMRPEELGRAQPDDVNLEQRAVVVRTAKRGRVRVVPLTGQAVSAWKEFIAADCWQRVPQAAPLNRWLKAQTALADLRVYDLRHSYGTALAVRQTRLDVIGALMGHSTLDLTRRYTLAAVPPDALTATAQLGRKVGRKVGSRKNTRQSA